MRKIVSKKVVDEVADWGHAGLIDSALLETLKARYRTDKTLGRVLLRWLGFSAVFMLGMSVLGFVGMVIGDSALYVAPLLLGLAAFAAWHFGVKLATDPMQHFAISGAVLVTASVFVAFATLATTYALVGGETWSTAMPVMMLIVALGGFATAYRYALRWPLLVAVLLTFHALGNRHGYWGSGSYFLNIRDEWLMLAVSAAAIGVGLWHEKFREADDAARHLGFGHVFVIVGLLYANLSLWLLSIPGRELELVLMFAAAGVAQLIIGARLHDGRFTGFGIVFLSINIYTRMFEGFWDDVSKGTFFLLAGAMAMGAGMAFEARAKRLRSST